MEIVHTPVLLEETLTLLTPRLKGERLCDATLGEGGHSEAFLERFPDLTLTGVDADAGILDVARERLSRFGERVRVVHSRSLPFLLGSPETFNTVLIDLGVSVYHYSKSGRGFSFTRDEPLDMRINTEEGEDAAALLARLSETEIADMLYNNAGERYSRRIARAIVQERSRAPIRSAKRLADIVAASVPGAYRHGHIHPATKTMQALRIEVNGEISGLPPLLDAARSALAPGGRLGVISFHSGESKIVKERFREWAKLGEVRLITKKAVGPSDEETRANAPSRSALLRVIEILEKI